MWHILKGKTNQWPNLVGYTLWADQVTMKKNMGYTPYYLLYGQHPLMPFNVTNPIFHALDWLAVTTIHELLAMRMCQLTQHEDLLERAVVKIKSFESRQQATQVL